MKAASAIKLAAIGGLLTYLLFSVNLPAGAASSTAGTSKAAVTINTVLDKMTARFADIKDISGNVDLEQVAADGTVIKAVTSVQACLPNLLRIKFEKPETFAGSIYVIDRKANKVMTYSPITEQVIISSIDQVISERYVPTTVEQLFSLPSPNDYTLTVVGTETKGNTSLVHITAKAKKAGDNQLFHFWINQDQWLVDRMQIFDNGKLLFTISLRDVKLNQNLSEAALKRMPAGAVSVYR